MTPELLLSTDIMALALKTQELGKALAECGIKHAHVVNAYQDARKDALQWNEGNK